MPDRARPFTGALLDIALAHQVSDLPPLPASVDQAVVPLLADLTAKDPCGRPGSAAEVASRAARLQFGQGLDGQRGDHDNTERAGRRSEEDRKKLLGGC